MPPKTLTKISILDFLLLSISAIIAFLLYGESNDKNINNSANNATLCSLSGVACGAGDIPLSCVVDNQDDLIYSCHMSAITDTTWGSVRSDAPPTIGNTSLSEQGVDHEDDTTSEILTAFKNPKL